jgi:hypothetical protein
MGDSYFWKKVALDFFRTFVAAAVAGFPTVLTAYESTGEAAALTAGAVLTVSALSAAFRAIQARFTNWETDSWNRYSEE